VGTRVRDPPGTEHATLQITTDDSTVPGTRHGCRTCGLWAWLQRPCLVLAGERRATAVVATAGAKSVPVSSMT